MRRSRRLAVARATIVALAVLTLGVGIVQAHALLQAGDPAPNAVLTTSPASVTLTFTEAPDPNLSSIRVLDSSGQVRTTTPPLEVPGHPEQLRVTVPPLPDGVYTVAWRTVSAVDGHDAAGSYAFSVGSPTGAPSGSAAPSGTLAAGGGGGSAGSSAGPSTSAVLARWALYLGLLGLLGVAFVGSVLQPVGSSSSGTIWRLALLDLLVAAIATVLLTGAQLGDAGGSLSELPGSSLGRNGVLRLAPLILAGGILAAARPTTPGTGRLARPALAAIGLLAAAGLLVEAVFSHAASETLAPAQIVIQWLHLIAVGLWLGGLVALLVEIRGPESVGKAQLARRFAVLGAFGIATVALTGILRAIVEVGSIEALVSSDFGRLVLLKAALLVPLAVLGALNHFRNVPQAERLLRPIRRAGSVELALGAVVLLVAAELVNIAPPTEVSAAANGAATGQGTNSAGSVVEVRGADFGTTVRLVLTVSPGLVGSNAFRATVTDYDTGKAVAATSIQLRFSLPSQPDVGASTLSLAKQTDGTFAGSGANLSLGGSWLVAALVQEATSSVEVDLQLAVKSPPQRIDVNRVTGAPTIYTVHLVGGRSVQIYLDPGKPGPNLLHATWFGADGNEMPVSGVTMAQLLASGSPLRLVPQVLDPGHEAAPVSVPSFPATFRISATGPGGITLTTQLQITPSS